MKGCIAIIVPRNVKEKPSKAKAYNSLKYLGDSKPSPINLEFAFKYFLEMCLLN
jgi:hypothetical protein